MSEEKTNWKKELLAVNQENLTKGKKAFNDLAHFRVPKAEDVEAVMFRLYFTGVVCMVVFLLVSPLNVRYSTCATREELKNFSSGTCSMVLRLRENGSVVWNSCTEGRLVCVRPSAAILAALNHSWGVNGT
jgi:hypothetical protein